MGVMNSGVTEFYKSICSVSDHAGEQGLVLYGAGFWGETACRIFSLFQVYPACFCDDDPAKQGTLFHFEGREIPIVSLDEAARRFPHAVYIAAATSGRGKARGRMNSRLKERGLLSADSGFHPLRYLFLLEGGMEALKCRTVPGERDFTPERIQHIIVLNHMMNSGIVYFDTLMDGHPNILNIAMLGCATDLERIYAERLQYLEGAELVMETASQMTPYFLTRFPDTVFGEAVYRPAERFLHNRLGEPEERVYVEPGRFIASLQGVLPETGRVSYGYLLKAVFAAYQNAAGKAYVPGADCWILYDRHQENYDMGEMDALRVSEAFQRLEYWFIIREPVQHIFSWIKRVILDVKDVRPDSVWYEGMPSVYLNRFSCDLGIFLEKTEKNRDKTVRIVRFEDVKKNTRNTMQSICGRMGIPFDECLLDTSVNGAAVYFPSVGKGDISARQRDVIASRDTTAVDRRDFSALLSSYDILRLNLACRNFKNAYGYSCDAPDYRTFSEAFLEELFREPFRFEPVLDEAGAAALEYGYLAPDESPHCHQHLTRLFLDYMKRGPSEFFTDVIGS